MEAAEEAGDDWDGGRVVWILRYVIQPPADSSWMKTDPFANFSDERHKLTTRLEVQKDDIQAVLPIAKVSFYYIFLLLLSASCLPLSLIPN